MLFSRNQQVFGVCLVHKWPASRFTFTVIACVLLHEFIYLQKLIYYGQYVDGSVEKVH